MSRLGSGQRYIIYKDIVFAIILWCVCVYSVIFIIIVLYLIKSTGLGVVGGIMVILQ